jgi:putative redox protein
MDIQFPGGMRVEALHDGYRIRTDQPVLAGGEGTAPSPFDLFLASVGTCAGYYALRFLEQRHIDTAGLAVTPRAEPSDPGRHVRSIRIEVSLPRAFPAKYRDAILRAIDQCAVKRHLVEPPVVEIVATKAGERGAGPRSTADAVGAASPPCWNAPVAAATAHRGC